MNGHDPKSWLSAFVYSAIGVVNRRRTIIALDSGAMPAFLDGAHRLQRILIWATLQCAGG